MKQDYHILNEEEIRQLDEKFPKRKRFYIYKITCLKTGHIYIGQRSNCNKPPIEDIKYMGSGYILQEEKKKYGLECFIKEILYEVSNQKDLDTAEKHEIQKAKEIYGDRSKKRSGKCINITNGGLVGCGFDHINKNPEKRKKAMDAAKEARSLKHNGDCMGACHTYESTMKAIETKKKNGSYQRSLDAMHSKEAKIKSVLKTSEKYIFSAPDGKLFVMARNTAKQFHKDWVLLKKFVEGTEEEQKLATQNTNVLKNTKRNTYIWINNGEKSKTIHPDEKDKFLKNGWVLGRGRLKKHNK